MQVMGTVSTIRFRNEENGWTVLVLSTEDGDITCTGTFLFIQEGELWEMEGDFVFHEKFGQQIQVKEAKKSTPKTADQIERYLSSGLIPHIGPKTAKKLVAKFGEDVIEKILEDESTILKIPGIGKKKAGAIRQALADQQENREIAIFLQGLELGPKTAAQIIQTYGEHTISTIEKNPYQLIDDVEGIGFRLADKIARNYGIDEKSPFRLKAAILYLLQREARDQGYSYLKREEVETGLTKLLGATPEDLDRLLFDLEIEGKLKHDHHQDRWYDRYIYDAENEIANKMAQMMVNPTQDVLDVDPIGLASMMGVMLADKQLEAIDYATKYQIMVLTGGPGTGKTTVLRAILNLFDNNGLNTVLAAPTGRAAKRMEESTERAAVTLHRLLGYRGGSEGDSLKPEKNEDDPLECDAIIIDEASMIDIYLMGNLMKAVQDNTRLVFVGDIDQLPSVGPGNVLQDLIQSEIIPTVKLDKIYRQSAESLIVTNAHRINHGEEPILNQPEKDFFFLPTANAIDALDVVIDLVIRRLPTHYGLRAKSDIQVLSAMKKGPCGVENLNQSLQQALNPKQTNRAEIEVRDQIFREGDSVMQTRNNYKMTWKERPSMKFSLLHGEDEEAEGEGVYNGDFGLIERIDPEGEWLEVDFEGRLARYTSEEFKDLIHSYAITIHKSQGSEFPCVVIPLVAGPPMLLTRNILYTAITRAKKLVVLVGSQNMLSSMIRNNLVKDRNSSLDERLRHYYELQKGLRDD